MQRVLKDFPILGTPFRGLILRGPFSLRAYIGVPQSHWPADMEAFELDCNHGVTFNGKGGEGLRPAGWHWYGWDCAHSGDRIDIPPGVEADLRARGIRPSFFRGKRWTLEEVEHEIIDVAINLKAEMERIEQQSAGVLRESFF